MLGLFVALGIAILTLLAILLWFLPYLLQQQAQQQAREATHLRALITEIMHEQEASTVRHMQLGASVAYLQDQLDQLNTRIPEPQRVTARMPVGLLETAALERIEHRLSSLQHQVAQQQHVYHSHARSDTEAWLYLLDLLVAMQTQIKTLSEQLPPHTANQR